MEKKKTRLLSNGEKDILIYMFYKIFLNRNL